MTNKSQTQEKPDSGAGASAMNDMAKEYIAMWQKQWVATMTDPKTQSAMKEMYQTMATMYDKNREVLFECTEALKRKNDTMEQEYHAAKRAPQSSGNATGQPKQQPTGKSSNDDEAGSASLHAALDQCVGMLGQLGDRLATIEGRLDELERAPSGRKRKKTSK